MVYGEKKLQKKLFYGDKILYLETDFWKLGCVPVLLRSLIRKLRASLVHTDTEIAEKYSNKHYAVDMLSNTLNTASYSLRNRVFLPTPPALDALP